MKICMEHLPPNRSFDILCVLKSAIVFFLFTSQAIKRIYMEQYRFLPSMQYHSKQTQRKS